jgi:hypothetical protein
MQTGLAGILGMAVLLMSVAGCAPKLTPQQEHGYRAIESCIGKGGQQDFTYRVLPDGAISFEGRADGFSPVQQCLQQQFGYRF